MKLEGKIYQALLAQLGAAKTKRLWLRRIHVLPGIAFTVLRCAKCGHEVHLEAHHQYGSGKLRPSYRKDYKRPKKWNGRCPNTDLKVKKIKGALPAGTFQRKLRAALYGRPGKPCGSKEWHYVKTMVMDHGKKSRLWSEVG